MICFRRFPELSARPIHFFSLRVYCLRPQIVQCYAPSVTGRLKETSSYLEPEMTRDWCHSEMNGRNDYNVVLLSFFPLPRATATQRHFYDRETGRSFHQIKAIGFH
jgi:hypothetical protein